MHTDTTLSMLDHTTTLLGMKIRLFKEKTCKIYITRELPKETAARGRRKAAIIKFNNQNTTSNPSQTKVETAKMKTLNINTYKIHALGHYVKAIRRYGTADSYNTQTVSYILNH